MPHDVLKTSGELMNIKYKAEKFCSIGLETDQSRRFAHSLRWEAVFGYRITECSDFGCSEYQSTP
jgi:hypothetical protein